MKENGNIKITSDFMMSKISGINKKIGCLINTGDSTYFPLITEDGEFSEEKVNSFIRSFVYETGKPDDSSTILRPLWQFDLLPVIERFMYVVVLSSVYNFLDYMKLRSGINRETFGMKYLGDSGASIEDIMASYIEGYVASNKCSQAYSLNSSDPLLVFFGMYSFVDNAEYCIRDSDYEYYKNLLESLINGKTTADEVKASMAIKPALGIISDLHNWNNTKNTDWTDDPDAPAFMHDKYVECFRQLKNDVFDYQICEDDFLRIMEEKTAVFCSNSGLSAFGDGDEDLYLDLYIRYYRIYERLAAKFKRCW